MTEPSTEATDPATIPRFPQVPGPSPERAPERLLSPIEEEEIERSRQRLLGRMRFRVEEIDQIFAQAKLWNETHANGPYVDPDSDDKLAAIRGELLTVMQEEAAK